jgi:hypothetical protein
VEFALQKNSTSMAAKREQALMYAHNVFADLYDPADTACVFILTVLYSQLHGRIMGLAVDAAWPTTASCVASGGKAFWKCATLNLITLHDVTEGRLARVFQGLLAALVSPTLPPPARQPSGCSAADVRHKIDLDAGVVYKFFNNTGRESVPQIVRSSVAWTGLGRATVVAGPTAKNKQDELGHMIIIRYLYLAGEHTARTVGQVRDVIQDLYTIHSRHFCHADVREANIVFSSDPGVKSQLIDFDLSGQPGKDTYPTGYNAVKDGERHPKASRGQTMEYAHDHFSLAAIMQFYRCVDEPVAPLWTKATALVKDGHLEQAVSTLATISEARLVRLLLVEAAHHPTGSPPR